MDMKKIILILILLAGLTICSGCTNISGILPNITGAVNQTTPSPTPDVTTTVIETIEETPTPEPAQTPTTITTVPTTVVTTNVVISKPESHGKLTVEFINVGQGDSEWIVSPSGETMLIDAGDDQDAKNITSVIGNVSNISIVVATHPHSDHIGGIQTILKSYTIGKFIDTGYNYNSAMYTSMIKTINAKNITYTTVKTGDYISFDPDVNVSVLNPQKKFFTELNDNSIVLLMRYKNVSILFTGDAGLNAESQYAKNLKDVNILKVSHHGSTTGTGAFLLSQISPKDSIISVGKNNYGHPDAATINKLKRDGSSIYRTDLNGTITFLSDGSTYSFTTSN